MSQPLNASLGVEPLGNKIIHF